jgi:hypothetical protein
VKGLRSGAVVAGCVLVFAAACGSGTTLGRSTSPATATRVPPPPTTTTVAPEGVATSTYTKALRSLNQAWTVTYVMNSHLNMGGEAIHTEREVTVDASREIASTRVRISVAEQGQQTTDLRLLVVNTADEAFLTMPAWTGSRRGKWMQFNEKKARKMGVQLVLSAPSPVPPGLEGFEVTGMSASGSILGTVDAVDGFVLLGMTGVFKDVDLAGSLTGRVPARLIVDRFSGTITSLEVSGHGHTVVDSSGSLPSEVLDLLSVAYSTVTIKQIGEPVDITLPASSDILSE